MCNKKIQTGLKTQRSYRVFTRPPPYCMCPHHTTRAFIQINDQALWYLWRGYTPKLMCLPLGSHAATNPNCLYHHSVSFSSEIGSANAALGSHLCTLRTPAANLSPNHNPAA